MQGRQMIITLFLLAITAGAQTELPPAPKSKLLKPTWSKVETGMIALSFAADGYGTARIGVREGNPLIRKFENSPAIGAYFGAAFAGQMFLTRWMRQHHHERMAHAVNWSLIAWESMLAASDMRVRPGYGPRPQGAAAAVLPTPAPLPAPGPVSCFSTQHICTGN